MLRAFNLGAKAIDLMTTSGIEKTAKQICYKIMDEAEKNLRKDYGYEGSVSNMDEAAKEFSIALKVALHQNSFSYEAYQKLCEPERNKMQEIIATHFVNVYKSYEILYKHVYFDGFNEEYTHNYHLFKHLDSESIYNTLINATAEFVREYKRRQQFVAFRNGCLDKNSIFYHLPVELSKVITNHLVSDTMKTPKLK